MKAAPAKPHNVQCLSTASDSATAVASLKRQAQKQLAMASLILLIASLLGCSLTAPGTPTFLLLQMPITTLALWGLVCLLLWRGLIHHPYAHFGAANTITLYRAAATVLLASWAPLASQLSLTGFWWLSLSALCLLTLDGLDGYLARRTGLASAFGARFDMEVDALLTLILSTLLWQSGELGIWILSLGLMRYAFILASTMFNALNQPLFPSFRRKLICVIQLGSLCAMLSPGLDPPWSSTVGLAACLLLTASFVRDTAWLLRTPS